jgi:hypothetical protein
VQHVPRVGRDSRQRVDRGFCFGDVAVGAAAQQGFDQCGGRRPAPEHEAVGDQFVEGIPGQLDGAVDVGGPGHPLGAVDVDDRHPDEGELVGQGHGADLREQVVSASDSGPPRWTRVMPRASRAEATAKGSPNCSAIASASAVSRSAVSSGRYTPSASEQPTTTGTSASPKCRLSPKHTMSDRSCEV